MPFGKKDEPGGPRVVDFDALYDDCIKPAAADADVEVIRADEETLGGIIHRPMYERLLLAEIVVADLTFANANVFYELGVRHAARPRSTILIYAQIGQLPFDVAPIRAIPYELDDDGALVEPDVLREELARRLAIAKTDDVVDSPLFQLLEDYPGISLAHDVTEAFRERALWVSDLTIRASDIVREKGNDQDAARLELGAIEDEARGAPRSEEQLLVSLMLAYRSIEAWDDMVRIAESLPGNFKAVPTIQEQLALALNRRNRGSDRNRAIGIVEQVIKAHGESPEALGILGRCLKARWREKEQAGDPGAADALSAAIDAYRRGFESDPRDFYPGVNLVTLLARRGDLRDFHEVRQLAPVVSFAIARKGALRSRDYWVLASVLEIAAVQGDEELGRRALSAMRDTQPDGWMRETTADNLDILVEALPQLDQPEEWVREIAQELRPAA
jgi:MAP3K TRAFs-binding domain